MHLHLHYDQAGFVLSATLTDEIHGIFDDYEKE